MTRLSAVLRGERRRIVPLCKIGGIVEEHEFPTSEITWPVMAHRYGIESRYH